MTYQEQQQARTRKANAETMAHYAIMMARQKGPDAAARFYEKDNHPDAGKLARLIRLAGCCEAQRRVIEELA